MTSAQQEPIYVFEWDKVPAIATVIGVSGDATIYALIESPGTGRVETGPGTRSYPIAPTTQALIFSAPFSHPYLKSISGLYDLHEQCCHDNPFWCLQPRQSRRPMHAQRPNDRRGTGSDSTVVNSTKKITSTSKSSGGGSSAALLTAGLTGTTITMSSIALGFCIALALLR